MTKCIVIVGLGYGDEGKGSITDFLVRRHNAKTVIRYNGGSQAAHTVVAPSGQTHTFAQFGSGTLVPGVRTHLSRYMKIDPLNMMVEEHALRAIGVTDAFARTTIDRQAVIITPFQKLANRLRERARGEGRHGSCGLGIGETQDDCNNGISLVADDLKTPKSLAEILRSIQKFKRNQLGAQGLLPSRWHGAHTSTLAHTSNLETFTNPSIVDQIVQDYTDFLSTGITIVNPGYLDDILRETVIFEGAQGILLDQDAGFHPYTTWSQTTTHCAEALLTLAGYPLNNVTRLGVMRAYMTRHGPGPFVTEDKTLTDTLPDSCNGFGEWQRDFRVGWPDLVMTRYAVEVNHGIDELAVTNLDRWGSLQNQQVCTSYDLEETFSVENNVARIRVIPRTPDQMNLITQRLLVARPLYAPAGDDYLNVLSAVIRTPITIESYGPTANDKIERQ